MDDADLPARPPDTPPPPVPERRLSGVEVERVIRRAVALQAREGEGGGAPVGGMSEAELVRMSSELGLAPRHIRQALAEVESEGQAEGGWFGRGFGEGVARASRVVRRDEAAVRRELEAYFTDRECMVVQRRIGDRIVYEQAAGVVAAVQRAATRAGARQRLLDAKSVEVTTRAVDEAASYVALAIPMTTARSTAAGVSLGVGTGLGGAAAAVLGIAIAPPAALVGIPLFLGSLLTSRAVYRKVLERTQIQLESLLDRLEHGELLAGAVDWRRRLGI